jgi:hypothetical protein
MPIYALCTQQPIINLLIFPSILAYTSHGLMVIKAMGQVPTPLQQRCSVPPMPWLSVGDFKIFPETLFCSIVQPEYLEMLIVGCLLVIPNLEELLANRF